MHTWVPSGAIIPGRYAYKFTVYPGTHNYNSKIITNNFFSLTEAAELLNSNCDLQVEQSDHQFLAAGYHSRVHQQSFVSHYTPLPLSIRSVQFV